MCSILAEELGEFAQALLKYDEKESDERLDHTIDEIKQVAMVSINIMDCLLAYQKEKKK